MVKAGGLFEAPEKVPVLPECLCEECACVDMQILVWFPLTGLWRPAFSILCFAVPGPKSHPVASGNYNFVCAVTTPAGMR